MTIPIIRKFRATCIVTAPTPNGPMFAGVINTIINAPAGQKIDAETIAKIERIVKGNKNGTQIDPSFTVTLAGLIELEQS